MSEARYVAHAHVTGGRNGHASTPDGALDVDLRGPVEMGGKGGGTNPEQLFAAGWAACFESTVRGQLRQREQDAKGTTIDSRVALMPAPEGGFRLAVEMDINIPAVQDPAVAVQAVKDAHKNCVYSRATRGNIDVKFTANGQPVDLD